jgi:hypothetical protein
MITWRAGADETIIIVQKVCDKIYPERLKPKEHPWELFFSMLGRLFHEIGDFPFAMDFWQVNADFGTSQDQLNSSFD